MGFFDNLVNKLPFSDADDEYEDEDLDNYEDEEEYDEPNTKVGFFTGRGKKNNRMQDEDDEEYDDNPSLWQRFKWWACDCKDRFLGWLTGDDDYEDDYEDDEEDDKEGFSYVDEDY